MSLLEITVIGGFPTHQRKFQGIRERYTNQPKLHDVRKAPLIDSKMHKLYWAPYT